jgi:hypothetical protein
MFNRSMMPLPSGGLSVPNSDALFNLQASGPGSNQYFNNNPAAVPMPGNTAPGAVPQQQQPMPPYATVPDWSTPGLVPSAAYGQKNLTQRPIGGSQNIGGGNVTIPTLDPALTSQLFTFLQSQIGQGVTPFNLSTPLPSGGQTQAGQLSAPLNPIETALMNFYQTGQGGVPGQQALQQQANGINMTPEWQAMLDAMNGPQGPIARQYAQIAQQFGASGGIGGSPYAQAVTQFGEQTALDQNALLAQMTMQGLQLQQNAATTLQSGGQSFGSELQGLDQQAISNLLNQFMIDSPQNNPYLQYIFGASTSSPGAINSKTGVGAAGAAVSSAGDVLQGIADLYGAIKGK